MMLRLSELSDSGRDAGTGAAFGECAVPADLVSPTALEFAELVAGYHGKVRLHTGGNDYGESIGWPAEEPDRPWAVLLLDGDGLFATLAFDFDNKIGDSVGDAARFSAALTALDIGHVVVRSGPSEGRHVLVPVEPRVPEAMARDLAEIVKADYASLDISALWSGTGSAIRPPLSLHRDGGRSEVIGDPRVALETLRRPNDPRKLLVLLERAGVSTLRHRCELTVMPTDQTAAARVSPNALTLLVTGKKASGDRSRSGVLWSALVGLVNAGFTFEEAVRTLTNPWYPISEVIAGRVRDKHRDVLDYLHHEWEKTCRWVQQNPPLDGPNDARIEVHEISEAASGVAWTGQTGSTDRAVLEALVAIGLRLGRFEFPISHREIAEKAKVSRRTVGKALARLHAAGWVTKQRGDGGNITCLRLGVPQSSPLSTSQGGSVTNGELSGIVLRQTLVDAFRRGGLPRSSATVIAALDDDEPKTVERVIAATGLAKSTVYTALKILTKHDLAAKHAGGGWRRHTFWETRLDTIAEQLGTAGATARQRQTHEHERDAYRDRFGSSETVADVETGVVSIVAKLGTWAGRKRAVDPTPPTIAGILSPRTTTTCGIPAVVDWRRREAAFKKATPLSANEWFGPIDATQITAERRLKKSMECERLNPDRCPECGPSGRLRVHAPL